MITVSLLAAEKLKDIMEEQGEKGSALRVICMPGPNGGAQYVLALEKEARGDDVVVQAEGISLLIDADTVPLMEGAEIDYLDGLMRSGFVISNPNIQVGECACGGACGCGGH